MSADNRKATPRVREHVDRLREAGLDTQKYYDALVALRDDTALPKNHRESLYKLIAMESFIWYMEALRNEKIDRSKVREEVRKLKAASEKPAIEAEKKPEAPKTVPPKAAPPKAPKK